MSEFQPESEITASNSGRSARPGIRTHSLTLQVAGFVAMAMLAVAPPTFAQRGGGGGGGGGSHGGGGGGGHSGGGGGWGGHSASSATHSSGSGSYAKSSGSAKHGLPVYGVGGDVKGSKPRETGVGGALRRFFGLSHESANQSARMETGAMPTGAIVSRAAGQASLPSAFSHVRLNSTVPSAFATNGARTERASELGVRPAVSAPPRPIGPPRGRFNPIFVGYGYGYGYGGYGFGFNPFFGFGFPILGFDCLYFNCFGNYFGAYFSSWNYGGNGNYIANGNYVPNAPPTMLLYLTNGSAVEVTDYWVDGDTFHYIAADGGKGEVQVSDVDAQRTTDANDRVGYRFNLDRTRRGTPLDRVEPPEQPEQQNPQSEGAGR